MHRAGQPARRSYLGGLVHPVLFRVKRVNRQLAGAEMAGQGKISQDKQWRSVAELEAGLISERTKAALKAAKARGVKLGRHGAEVLALKNREEALRRALQLEPVIGKLMAQGLSLAKIAGELNKLNVPTPRGGRWDHSSVRNVLNRIRA